MLRMSFEQETGGMTMRKKLAALLILSTSLFVFGCGEEKKAAQAAPASTPQAVQTVTKDYAQQYAPIVESAYAFVLKNGEEKEGFNSLAEVKQFNGTQKAGELIGYTLQDISGDGVPELLLGYAEQKQGQGVYGSDIYAVYTLENGKPQLQFEAWFKDRLRLLKDNTLFMQGTSGAAESYTGRFALEGTQKKCLDFFFTKPDEQNPGQIIVYHNQTGASDSKQSEKSAVSLEELGDMGSDFSFEPVEFLPLKNYPQQGFKGLAKKHINIAWQRDSRLDLAQAESFSAPNAAPSAKVVLTSDEALPSFKVLGLEVANIDEGGQISYTVKDLYTKDSLPKNAPFVLTLTTFESIPYTGIAFEDDLGRVRRFAIGQSGMDGSVYLSEF